MPIEFPCMGLRCVRKHSWCSLLARQGVALAVVWFLGFSTALCAQTVKPPTLEEILRQLDANLHHYDAAVPSLFCSEHAVSEVWPGAANENTVTDSIFRLRRTAAPGKTAALVESREIQKVNGKPASSQNIDGPTLLSGVFEGGLAVISLSQQACMRYELEPGKKKRPGAPYTIRFATALTPQNAANCLLQESSKGRAFIDPASMEITHLELTTPHHVIAPADAWSPPVTGKRVLTVDYAPLELGGGTFWMPATITMQAIRGENSFHKTIWSFQATYSNYHKLEVTTRIVPGSSVPVK
jgi:hypothetical protein